MNDFARYQKSAHISSSIIHIAKWVTYSHFHPLPFSDNIPYTKCNMRMFEDFINKQLFIKRMESRCNNIRWFLYIWSISWHLQTKQIWCPLFRKCNDYWSLYTFRKSFPVWMEYKMGNHQSRLYIVLYNTIQVFFKHP